MTYSEHELEFTFAKKFQDFSGTSKTFPQDSVEAQQCLNIQMNCSYLLHIYTVTVQSIMKHKSQVQRNLAGILDTFIYQWYSTHKRYID